jgi:rhomboid protease GluP
MMQTPVTRILIVINVIVFLLMSFTNTTTTGDLIGWGANYGPLTTNGEWWRLGSAMFIHIGLLHLFFNMLALWNLGLIVESAMGGLAFTVLYVLSGLAGSIMSVAWHPDAVSAGASGAIFGLFGGMMGLLGRRYLISGISVGRGVIRSLLVNILINLGISLIPGIDMAAHGGGLMAGLALGMVIDPEPRRENWWQHPLMIGLYGLTLLAVAFSFVPKAIIGG